MSSHLSLTAFTIIETVLCCGQARQTVASLDLLLGRRVSFLVIQVSAVLTVILEGEAKYCGSPALVRYSHHNLETLANTDGASAERLSGYLRPLIPEY